MEIRKQLEEKDIEDIDELIKSADVELINQIIEEVLSRGISGKNYGVMDEEEFKELAKIVNMFLKLSYWN